MRGRDRRSAAADGGDGARDLSCACESENTHLAYCSQGCVRCTSGDCALYIQNFVQGFAGIYGDYVVQ